MYAIHLRSALHSLVFVSPISHPLCPYPPPYMYPLVVLLCLICSFVSKMYKPMKPLFISSNSCPIKWTPTCPLLLCNLFTLSHFLDQTFSWLAAFKPGPLSLTSCLTFLLCGHQVSPVHYHCFTFSLDLHHLWQVQPCLQLWPCSHSVFVRIPLWETITPLNGLLTFG